MLRRFELTCAVFVMLCMAISAAAADPPIASPAIDDSLFKEGAIQRRELDSGAWYAKCQEIVKVKKLICNLLSSLPNQNGGPSGSILIATTDTGVPAAMIVLPKDVSLGRPISVKSSNLSSVDGRAVKVEYSTVASSVRCDDTCKYMFPLDPRLVFILNAGESASIFVPAEEPPPTTRVKKKDKKVVLPLYSIPGNGFAEALKASTQGW
jgi:invasion protein IalB